MRSHTHPPLPSVGLSLFLVCACGAVGCGSDSGARGGAGAPAAQAWGLIDLLPAGTRGAMRVDLRRLLRGDSSAVITDLLQGRGSDAAIVAPFVQIARLSLDSDTRAAIDGALLVHTADPRDGFALLATMGASGPRQAIDAAGLEEALRYEGQPLYVDPSTGLHATVLPENRLVVGGLHTVRSVIDVFVGRAEGASKENGPIGPYLPALGAAEPVCFVCGLPMLDGAGSSVSWDALTLGRARVLSGALDFAGESFSGALSFHMNAAADFVATYDALGGGDAGPRLRVAPPLSQGLPSAVEIAIDDTPIHRSVSEIVSSRRGLKRLYHGMNAVAYAGAVRQGGNAPWLRFGVGDSPRSVFINFEMRSDQIEAFERNELPTGFRLKPLRVLESDEPSYFLVLNAYQAFGGLVSDARAEWSVFVEDPVDGRPRFLVVQAAAATVSADSVNLLTPAEPVTHALEGGAIVTHVAVQPEDPSAGSTTYWRSSLAWPQAEPIWARTARELVAANDFIYWGNGVADRGLYDATAHNRDVIRIRPTDVQIVDNTRWRSYVHSVPKHSYAYTSGLDFVVSPWWNLDAEYLDVTPEHRQALVDFKDGFYPRAAQQLAASAVADGEDVLAGFTVGNATPAAHYNFAVRDVSGLQAQLGLPPGHVLAKTTIFESDEEAAHYVTLRVLRRDGALEGQRAQWCTYTDDGSGRAHLMVIAAMTSDVAVDPVTLLGLPSAVQHRLEGRALRTEVWSAAIQLEATADLAEGVQDLPSLDWVEAGDFVCHLNGICDKVYYDGATMEAAVLRLDSARVDELRTPWDGLIDPEPVSVLVRENSQRYASLPWHNVR